VRRQTEVARETAEAGMKAFSDVSVAAPEERLAKQADFAKSSYAAFFANSKEIYDMAVKTTDEAIGLINDRVTASIEESKKVFAAK
jgi:phasin family protein